MIRAAVKGGTGRVMTRSCARVGRAALTSVNFREGDLIQINPREGDPR
jgi:hypothetical protein